jgi:hypothetical protein
MPEPIRGDAMTDKTELQQNHDGQDDAPEGAKGNEHDIFEQRFHELTDGFRDQCEKHGVPVAIAIAIYPTPKDLNEAQAEFFEVPMVFFKGEMLESMSLAAQVLRNFKTNLSESLDTNPR